VHVLRLHEGSAFDQTPAGGHDLCLSAALDGTVKLWDLRSAACVRRFAAHTNRVHPIGAALSPCLRYVACGSEDRSAYIFDALSGALVERLRGVGAEITTDAAFSPLHPQLAVASLDGRVRFFSDKADEG
jgi:WD40 repeat protein